MKTLSQQKMEISDIYVKHMSSIVPDAREDAVQQIKGTLIALLVTVSKIVGRMAFMANENKQMDLVEDYLKDARTGILLVLNELNREMKRSTTNE